MSKYVFLAFLLVLAGCVYPSEASRFGVGDRVIIEDNTLGVVLDSRYSAEGNWRYEIYTKSGVKIWIYDTSSSDEAVKNIKMYDSMDWNVIERAEKEE